MGNKDNENDARGSGSEGTRESRSRSRSRSRSSSPERQPPHEESYHTAPEHEMSIEENKDDTEPQQSDEPKQRQESKQEIKEENEKKEQEKEEPMEIQDEEKEKKEKEDEKSQEKETKPVDPWRSVSPSKVAKHRRMISITSRKDESKKEDSSEIKTEPGARKRRWGSKTGKNTSSSKKPTLSISTDSLKAIIPDIKAAQMDAVTVDLGTEESRVSDTEETPQRSPAAEEITIRRTVTQVVPSPAVKEEENEDPKQQQQSQEASSHEKNDTEQDEDVEPMEVEEKEEKKVTPPKVIRRQLSNLPVDEPVTTSDAPSPARMPISNIVHVMNLVRPFTINQLKELLSRTGNMLEDGFWIDKIKSHCFVTYETEEQAITTREALHGTKWPSSNPKNLIVEYAQQSEIDRQKGIHDKTEVKVEQKPEVATRERRDSQRERERERRDREKERERERGKEREADKMRQKDRSPSRETKRRDRERERGKERQRENKKDIEPEEPPAKLLDDLFRKTKATPCIYWLPLSADQIVMKEKERVERNKQREERRKKLEQERVEEEARRERERQKRRQEQRRSRSRSRDRRRR